MSKLKIQCRCGVRSGETVFTGKYALDKLAAGHAASVVRNPEGSLCLVVNRKPPRIKKPTLSAG